MSALPVDGCGLVNGCGHRVMSHGDWIMSIFPVGRLLSLWEGVATLPVWRHVISCMGVGVA